MNDTTHIEVSTPQGRKPSSALHMVDEDAQPLVFALFIATVGSVLCSTIWVLSNLAGHSTLSAQALWQSLVAALPALGGALASGLATWGAFQRTRAASALRRYGLSALCSTSALLALLCWGFAVRLAVA